MIRGHEVMIQYEKQNQKVHIQIYKFIVVYSSLLHAANFREVFYEVGHNGWQKHVEGNAVYILQQICIVE